MTKQRNISESELTVLRTLWRRREGVVREIAEDLEKSGVKWAYTTVQTLLNRLEVKGYVKRDTSGTAHTYRPAMSREKLVARRLHDLADQLCEGASTPLVMALVDNVRLSQEDIAHLRELLDRLDESTPNANPPNANE
ncbi:MAG: BlaI/MecI/CopY family transcriptional regulator [Candidatus Hydrogenedentes bacterium]|nr:BlaI/MecI/CopY family transcriptional regulator [Candidatus Hydrogenedentota bacterium]